MVCSAKIIDSFNCKGDYSHAGDFCAHANEHFTQLLKGFTSSIINRWVPLAITAALTMLAVPVTEFIK